MIVQRRGDILAPLPALTISCTLDNGGGGVFLAISQSISFLDLSMTTSAEMIWARITPILGEPIAIG